MAKTLRRLSRVDRERLAAATRALPDGDVRPLKGKPGEWRLRVGDWRLRFHRDDAERVIDILLVASRGAAYRTERGGAFSSSASPQRRRLLPAPRTDPSERSACAVSQVFG